MQICEEERPPTCYLQEQENSQAEAGLMFTAALEFIHQGCLHLRWIWSWGWTIECGTLTLNLVLGMALFLTVRSGIIKEQLKEYDWRWLSMIWGWSYISCMRFSTFEFTGAFKAALKTLDRLGHKILTVFHQRHLGFQLKVTSQVYTIRMRKHTWLILYMNKNWSCFCSSTASTCGT